MKQIAQSEKQKRTEHIYTKSHKNNMLLTCLNSSWKNNGFFIIHEDVWKKSITATQLVITDMLRTETCETVRFQGTKDLS